MLPRGFGPTSDERSMVCIDRMPLPFVPSRSRNDRVAGLEKKHPAVLPPRKSFDTAFGLLRTNGPRGQLETSMAS